MAVMNTTATPSEISHLWNVADSLDRISSLVSLAVGIPGNLLAVLTFLSFPRSVTTFHFLCLTLADLLSLCLQIMLRFLVWNDVVEIDSHKVNIGWKLLFNFTYYTGILANWILVWLAAERLLSVAWPDQVKIYLTEMRAKLYFVLEAMLCYSFALIVTIKMDYFGVAWLVVFSAFYTVTPQLLVLIECILLIKALLRVKRSQDLRSSLRRDEHHHHHHHHHHHKHGKHSDKDSMEDTKSVIEAAVTMSLMQRSQSDCGDFRKRPFDAPTKLLSVSNTKLSRSYGHIPTQPLSDKYTIGKSSSKSTMLSRSTLYDERRSSREEWKAEIMARIKDQVQLETAYTIIYLVCAFFFLALTIPHSVVNLKYVFSDIDRLQYDNDDHAEMHFLLILSLAFIYGNHSLKFYIYFGSSSLFRRQVFRAIVGGIGKIRSSCGGRHGRCRSKTPGTVRIMVDKVEAGSEEGPANGPRDDV
ncbi:hypothetical protein PoB_006392300 [Plakobranchus ocellatus]|uniref:G-protein coupled receptors family 1 profile domain-containing protein n=1 Tax=Plakobranchus ocellatus TaxID=259542 RepID=A0AAV4D048_9GAST|nr:hypothetical protein PoB_006392300 [Plakobranchus ocellatus]